MMQGPGLAPVIAATFTLGCVAIHGLQRHALRTTRVLVLLLAVVALVYVAANALIHPEAEADEYDLLTTLQQAP